MPHDNLHYWLRGCKRGTMSKQKITKLSLSGTNFWTMKTVIMIQRCCKYHCFQWKQACWENDWLIFEIYPIKKSETWNSSQRETLNVGWHFYGIAYWHTIMSSMDAYKWHLNLFFVELKQEKCKWNVDHTPKLEWRNWERARKNNRWLQLSWRASGI